MNKKICLFLLLIFIFQISTIYACDGNITDLDEQTSFNNNFNQFKSKTESVCVSLDDYSLKENYNQTQLTSQSASIYYKGSYKVILKDLNSSKPISNKNVNFIINNINYISETDDSGVAGVNLDLNPGKYAVYAYFSDDEYQNCSLSDTIEILSTIKSNDVTKYYKGTTPFTAQFLNENGGALANREVTISVNGKAYSLNTNNDGFISFQINLKPGSYSVLLRDPLTGYTLTKTFTILPTISSSNTKQVVGQNKRFIVKFFKSNGQPLSKQYVKYKFKGKVHKIKTNVYGQFGFSLKKFKKGTYKITCYNKDRFSKSFYIKIYKRKASTKLTSQFYNFLPNDNREISVKLSTALGDNSNAGKTLRVKINGHYYSLKTDGEGIARLNLKSFAKGLYKVEYSYKGNNFFKSSKTTNYVTILDTSQADLTVKSTMMFGYGAGTLFKVALTAGGVPLINRIVNINIAGTTYSKTTDGEGCVSVPVDLKIGKYIINYNSFNQFGISETSGSCEIEVFKRSESKLTWSCGNSYKDSSQTFNVLLTDLNGNPISGGSVEFTVDSKKYSAVTSSSGHAIIKTRVALGNYKVSVKFTGNNNYLSSDTSQNIEVKLSQFGKGLNEKGSASLGAYIKSSSHCKVGSSKVKSLVKSLTKGLKSNVDKAKAIFNFVRDKIQYSFYYNSHFGSGGTLKYKKGNCVDIAHLLVSMYRTAGFKARYVHGKCKFNSGNVYGHVWSQVRVGKYWICADASDNSNSLGKILNWNIKSYKVHARYSSLPF